MTITYTQFVAQHPDKVFWACAANPDEQGRPRLDVLVYDSQADLDADVDNSLAIDRKTVIDDKRRAIDLCDELAVMGIHASDDTLGVVIRQAIADDPDVTADQIAEIWREATEDAAAERPQ